METAEQTARYWSAFYAFCAIIGEGPAQVSIQVDGVPQALTSEIDFSNEEEGGRKDAIRSKLLKGAALLFEAADHGDGRETVRSIFYEAKEIEIFQRIATGGQVDTLRLELKEETRAVGGEIIPLLYFKVINFWNHSFIYCARVNFQAVVEGGNTTLVSRDIKLKDVKRVSSDEEIDAYINKLRSVMEIESYFLAERRENAPPKLEQTA